VITAEVVVWISRASLREPANLFSLTPNLALDFFLMGNFSLRKLMRTSGAFPALVLLIASRAIAEDSKGKNSLRLAILLKDSKFAICV
jgi:hypothetical protein